MKRFLERLALLALLLLPAIVAIDYLYSSYLRSSDIDGYEIWNDILQPHPAADMVCMGSSRAFTSFNPVRVDSLLGTHSWNLGVSASRVRDEFYRYSLFRRFNPAPSYVLQVLDYNTFIGEDEYFSWWQLYPFLWDPVFREAVYPYRSFSFAERFIPLYRYRGLGMKVMESWIHPAKVTERGYRRHERPWDRARWQRQVWYSEKNTSLPEQEQVAILEDFLDILRADSCRLVFVCPPVWEEADRSYIYSDSIRTCFRELAERYDAPFLDYTMSQMSSDSTLFYDGLHLNCWGADRFSDSLAADLNRLYHFVQ